MAIVLVVVIVSFAFVEVVSVEVGTTFADNDLFDLSTLLVEEASTALSVEEKEFYVDFDVSFNLCFDRFYCFGWDNESSSFLQFLFLVRVLFPPTIYLYDGNPPFVDQYLSLD